MSEFSVTVHQTPKRDVDLFGPTTVRIDRRRSDEIAGVPVLYLSAYVADDEDFARKVVTALAWVTDGTVSVARAGVVPNKPTPEAATAEPVEQTTASYSMPEFVEDVVYGERLDIADPMTTELWKAWAEAVVRRLELAVDSQQVAALLAANDYGMKFCPPHHMGAVRFALNEAFSVTHNQAAAA